MPHNCYAASRHCNLFDSLRQCGVSNQLIRRVPRVVLVGLEAIATVRGELQRVVRVCGARSAGREGCLKVWWLLLLWLLSMQTCRWELGGGVCWMDQARAAGLSWWD